MKNNILQNVLGNSIDIKLTNNIIKNYSEIKADIPVVQYNSIRMWGQVKDSMGNPIPYALLKLIKYTNGKTSTSYCGIAHTTADCQGFYQFDLCPEEGAEYKILVSKPNIDAEFTIESEGNCPPSKSNYDVCPEKSSSTTINPTDKN